MAYLTLFYRRGALIAHLNVNWLAPVKVRQTLDRRQPQDDRLRRSGAEREGQGLRPRRDARRDGHGRHRTSMLVGYRIGDMWAPQLAIDRGAATEIEHFVDCIATGASPLTDGESWPAGRRDAGGGHALDGAARPARRVRTVTDGVMIPFLDLQAQYARSGPSIEAAVLEVLRSGAIRPRRRGRGASRRSSPPTAAPSRRSRVNSGTSRAAPRAARCWRRPRRRGDHRADDLRRDGRRHRLRRRDAGLRRHRPAHLDHGPGAARSGDHAADQGDPAGAPARAAGRHGRDHRRSRGATASSSSRTRPRRTARSTTAGAPARSATSAASASIRARTSAPTARAARSSTNDADLADADPLAARLGPGGQVQPRPARLQLPHGRDAGRGARREARASRRLDRSGAGRLRRATRRCSATGHRHGQRRAGAEHVYHVYAILRRRPRRAARASCRRPAWRPASTIRCPVHLQPAYADARLRAGRLPGQRGDRAATRCRCRCIPR